MAHELNGIPANVMPGINLPGPSTPRLDAILAVVAARWGISVLNLKDKSHFKPYADARHVAMYVAREMTVLSLPVIGRAMGSRHHTTVLHGVRKVRNQLSTNLALVTLLAEIDAEVRNVAQQKLVYQQERRALGIAPVIYAPGSSSKGAT